MPGIAHTYLAATSVAALPESAFHTAAPPAPRLPLAQLAHWSEAAVALTDDLRLFDLRDPELARLGIHRDALVTTSPAHYPCTRTWAAALHGRRVGGHPTHGIIWDSRQAEARAVALAGRPAVRELMTTAPSGVMVIWSPPAPADILKAAGGLGRLDRDAGLEFVIDLAAALAIPMQ